LRARPQGRRDGRRHLRREGRRPRRPHRLGADLGAASGVLPGSLPLPRRGRLSTRSMAIDRREFVGVGALGLFGLVPVRAGEAPGFEAPEPAAQDVTRRLAAYVVHARIEDVPAPIRAEACRTLLNWAG